MHEPTATLRGPEGVEERITVTARGYVARVYLRCGWWVQDSDTHLADGYALARHAELRLDAGWETDEAPPRSTASVGRYENRSAGHLC